MDIFSTTDYKKFNIIKRNRDISNVHLERLIKSINKNNYLEMNPILVNGEMEVIDGQHRLEAAKQLGVPIFYRVISMKSVEKSEDVLITMNITQRPWRFDDYVKFYSNDPNVKILVELSKEYRVSKFLIYKIFGSLKRGRKQKTVAEVFEDGLFFNRSEEEIRKILDFSAYLYESSVLESNYNNIFRSLIFISCMLHFYEKGASMDRLIMSILRTPYCLPKTRDPSVMRKALVETYNKGLHEGKKLKYNPITYLLTNEQGDEQ